MINQGQFKLSSVSTKISPQVATSPGQKCLCPCQDGSACAVGSLPLPCTPAGGLGQWDLQQRHSRKIYRRLPERWSPHPGFLIQLLKKTGLKKKKYPQILRKIGRNDSFIHMQLECPIVSFKSLHLFMRRGLTSEECLECTDLYCLILRQHECL